MRVKYSKLKSLWCRVFGHEWFPYGLETVGLTFIYVDKCLFCGMERTYLKGENPECV